MADVKISALPAASAAAGTDEIPVNSGGTTEKVTVNQLFTAPTIPSYIQYTAISNPAAPSAGSLRFYAKDVGGRIMPKWISPTGVDNVFQPGIFSNSVVWWSTTTATAGLWIGTAGAGAGTYTTQLPTTTNNWTAIKRGRWSSVVTTANQQVGQRNTELMFFRGGVTTQGGFFFFCRFGMASWTANTRYFIGLANSATPVTAQPSAMTNCCGFGIDAGDTAFTFMTNDGSGTATKNAIAGQPALAAGNGYDAYIFCAPGGSTVYYRLVSIQTGAEIVNSSVVSDLPVATTMMAANAVAGNAAVSTVDAVQIEVNRIYVDSDT